MPFFAFFWHFIYRTVSQLYQKMINRPFNNELCCELQPWCNNSFNYIYTCIPLILNLRDLNRRAANTWHCPKCSGFGVCSGDSVVTAQGLCGKYCHYKIIEDTIWNSATKTQSYVYLDSWGIMKLNILWPRKCEECLVLRWVEMCLIVMCTITFKHRTIKVTYELYSMQS